LLLKKPRQGVKIRDCLRKIGTSDYHSYLLCFKFPFFILSLLFSFVHIWCVGGDRLLADRKHSCKDTELNHQKASVRIRKYVHSSPRQTPFKLLSY
jgi:hypothetical protein